MRLTKPKGGKLSWAQVHGRKTTIKASYKSSAKIKKSTHTIVSPLDRLNKIISKSQGRKRGVLLGLRADLYTLLSLYDRSRQPSPPRVDLEEAIQLAPDIPLLRFLYGFRVARVNRSIGQNELQATIRVDPKFTPAIVKLAEFARTAGRSADERRLLQKALHIAPQDLQANIQYADAQFRNEFEREAAFPTKATLQKRTQSLLFKRTKHNGAQARQHRRVNPIWEKITELNQQQHHIRSTLVSLLFRAGKHELSLDLLRKGIELWPYRVSNYVRLIELLKGLKRISEAEEFIKIARGRFPQELSLTLAKEIALQNGNQSAAIASLRASLAIDPNQINVRRQLNQIVGQKNDLEELVDEDADKITTALVSSKRKSTGLIYLLDKQAIQLYAKPGNSHAFINILFDYMMKTSPMRSTTSVSISHRGASGSKFSLLRNALQKGTSFEQNELPESRPRGKVAGIYVDQRWKLIQFKKINAGDSIHIRYRIDSVGPNMFGDSWRYKHITIRRTKITSHTDSSRAEFSTTLHNATTNRTSTNQRKQRSQGNKVGYCETQTLGTRTCESSFCEPCCPRGRNYLS